jgi:hypothetical protein
MNKNLNVINFCVDSDLRYHFNKMNLYKNANSSPLYLQKNIPHLGIGLKFTLSLVMLFYWFVYVIPVVF